VYIPGLYDFADLRKTFFYPIGGDLTEKRLATGNAVVGRLMKPAFMIIMWCHDGFDFCFSLERKRGPSWFPKRDARVDHELQNITSVDGH
jgi:hypothetical protein